MNFDRALSRAIRQTIVIALVWLVCAIVTPIQAQDWRGRTQPSRQQQPPPGSFGSQVIPPAVERQELAPVMAGDGSGMPHELWNGLDVETLEKLISRIQIPPQSPALHNLLKRLLETRVSAPSGDAASVKFAALRQEVLYRAGMAGEVEDNLAAPGPDADPLLTILRARNQLAANKSGATCTKMKSASLKGDIPARLKGQAILMTGYCAVKAGKTAAAGLVAELARNEGVTTNPGLQALDAIAAGHRKARFTPVPTITLLDYRLAQEVGGLPSQVVLQRGEPALLVALANDPKTTADLGMPASEAAARFNAISPEVLAAIYRANASGDPANTPVSDAGGQRGPFRRAALFKAAEATRDPNRQLQFAQAFLNAMDQQGLRFQAMVMIAPAISKVSPSPENSWFAETAAEIGVTSGQYDITRQWARGGGLEHWLALADIGDTNAPNRGAYLRDLERMALAGRFSSDALHRLATVFDALLYQVPIPLWDAASRTPQPNDGHLPETGVLSQLQEAAKKCEFGRTVLLAMNSLGPKGAKGAHMIALGDSIRALKQAGLEENARRIGIEALIDDWPRRAPN